MSEAAERARENPERRTLTLTNWAELDDEADPLVPGLLFPGRPGRRREGAAWRVPR